MIRFNKKMIKAIIDIITSEPTKRLPSLQSMRIRRDGFAYITNGYIAIRYKFQTEIVPVDPEEDEFIITAKDLLLWYHEAKASDYLSEISIVDLATKTNNSEYPDVSYLFDEKIKRIKEKRVSRFDEKLLNMFCRAAGNTMIEVYPSDVCVCLKSVQDEQIEGILMEIR